MKICVAAGCTLGANFDSTSTDFDARNTFLKYCGLTMKTRIAFIQSLISPIVISSCGCTLQRSTFISFALMRAAKQFSLSEAQKIYKNVYRSFAYSDNVGKVLV